jgi:hypothetical protein
MDADVLPGHANVFLVDADGVVDGVGPAPVVAEVGVEVADLPEAVAAQLERLRGLARPTSPASNALRQNCVRAVSPYGMTISATPARCRIEHG